MDVSALDSPAADRAVSPPPPPPPPDVACSAVSRLLFSFCEPLLKKGYRGVLGQEDIWTLRPGLSCSGPHTLQLEQSWQREQAREHPSLLRAMLRAYRWQLLQQMALSVAWAALVVVGPAWFLPNILLFLQDPTWVTWLGCVFIRFFLGLL